MKNVWRWVERLAVIAGIVGLGLSVYALLRVEQLDDLVQTAESNWEKFSVSLDEPQNGVDLHGHLQQISGSVQFDPNMRRHIESVRLQLRANQVELLPMVRPIAEPLRWWPQPAPAVADDGSYRGTVRIGRSDENADLGDYEIVVVAVPVNAVARTETYIELPPHYAQSEIVLVSRKR